jgi:hypothetical protein
MTDPKFSQLISLLRKVPSIKEAIGAGTNENGNWWVKFTIDIKHELAWHVVQEFGHIVNYLSVSERLPACFYPVSAPPYLNGGPEEYLSWAIDTFDINFSPDLLAEWLESRLPKPLDDISQWEVS